ncbi:MAG: transposase [Planctomycetota bacterium]
MPYRGDVFAEGHYYHIYNRGAGKAPIFFQPDDYEHCLRLIKRHREQYGVCVVAYCLMPNHYHFCLRQEGEQALSRFMAIIFNSYVQAVNRRRERAGTLFQGRFRHAWIDREEYLAHLCRYIHLNPVKANLASRPGEWPYSNYPEWVGARSGTLKDQGLISALFPTAAAYERFVADGRDEEKSLQHIRPYVWDWPPGGRRRTRPPGGRNLREVSVDRRCRAD